VSSSSRSAHQTDPRDELLRRFVEAARRAQIVTIVNRARTEDELGELVSAELSEALEAEIAFVLALTADDRTGIVGTYGLSPEAAAQLASGGLCSRLGTTPSREEGSDLLGLGARALVRAPFGAGSVPGVVGVARLYAQPFDEAETALLEAVAESIEHAIDRLRLAAERDRLYRQAHERAQAARVIGSIADGVLLVDTSGVVQLWNPAAEAITGLASENVVGRAIETVVPRWNAIQDSLAGTDDPRSASARGALVPFDSAGGELWLSIRSVSFDEGTVYAFNDLTEEHRLEQLKADFIATVSHELRTPLAAVHGAAKTLGRPDMAVGGPVFEQMVNLIAEQSERLSAMVDEILLASRVDSPEFPLTSERVDVGQIAAQVVAAARAHASQLLTLEVVARRPLPQVVADADKLRQVLTNLVANAVKYSPEGGLIEIDAEERNEQLAIIVRDQGLGIAPVDQRRIFERFYRADANMNRGVSGSGLGLYISRELVQRMGGTIRVESRLGKGSTFVVTLPLAEPQMRRTELLESR
jgi:PAS domain S-box-containing protein